MIDTDALLILLPSIPAVMALAASAGVVGTFAVLRGRALMADTLAHATLPGIAGAYLVATAFGGDGRSLPVLLLGATATGLLGLVLANWLQRAARLGPDAAMAAVLAFMFGIGTVLMSVVQRSAAGGQAGLSRFLLGQTASITTADAVVIVSVASVCLLVCALLYKELRLLCFDESVAQAQGFRPRALDAVLMVCITAMTVVGLQAVGLVLVVAVLIIPPVAARLWSNRLWAIVLIAAAIGAASAGIGGAASGFVPRVPAGPAIVLSAGAMFVLSALLAPRRGVIARAVASYTRRQTAAVEHALRAAYEAGETQRAIPAHARVVLLARDLAVQIEPGSGILLTPEGQLRAEEVTTRHRLWERYLMAYGSKPPEHADATADLVEHLRDPVLLAELANKAVPRASGGGAVPPSPHDLASSDSLGSQR